MKTIILASILAVALQAAEPAPRTAVLAELFTSEGCSSCPSADVLLMKLDKLQPVAGAQIIVLSEHVDYWNSLGWSDPFSSAQFTQRQAMYARLLTDDSYTPQLVIDGRKALVGSNEKDILPAIQKAATRAKTSVRIAAAKRDDGNAVVSLAIGPSTGKVDVWVAVADDHDQSNVRRGENTGKTLNHVAVVRTLAKVASIPKAGSLEKEVRVPLGAQSGAMRVVVFVSEPGGPIQGSALRELQ